MYQNSDSFNRAQAQYEAQLPPGSDDEDEIACLCDIYKARFCDARDVYNEDKWERRKEEADYIP